MADSNSLPNVDRRLPPHPRLFPREGGREKCFGARMRVASLWAFVSFVPFVAALAEEKSPAAVVLKDATIFDSAAGKMLPHRTVVIAGESIAAIGTPEQPAKIPPNARTIDCAGKFVIPGLIDAHVHLVHLVDRTHVTGDEFLPLFLAAGVTSVRSTGDAIVAEVGVDRFARAHPAQSPRVFLCSPLIDGAPVTHADVGVPVVDVAQVPKFIDDMVAWKVTTLKIYVGTPRPIGRAVIELAHRRDLVVTGHLGLYSAQDAVEDGIDCLEHIWSVFNYSIPAEVIGKPNYRADLDLENPKCQALVASLVKHHTVVDPTLVVFRNMLYLNDISEVQQHPDLKFAPARMRRYWDSYVQTSLKFAPETLDARKREIAKYQALTGILHRAGVPLLCGTDAPEPYVTPGFSMHQELELLVGSGLSPAAAIQTATINNARIVRQEDKLGRIEPGLLADLVILRTNPLDDIRRTRDIESVVRGGLVVSPEDLLRLVPKE